MATLEQEINVLKDDILKMGVLVQEIIQKAVKSMVTKDVGLAYEVKQQDDLVDEMELQIEQKCLTMLALKQPMAGDLRAIGTAFRVIVDLERICDHAEDLADITIRLKDEPYIKPLIDIPHMADLCQRMLRDALNAYVKGSTELAYSLVELETQVDQLYDQVFRELLVFMMQDPRTITQATALLLAAGHLERMADHVTNIGEMVIYMVEGDRIDMNRLARERMASKEGK
ncbi:MAG: phosphate signaling complex protein PhoU [Methylocystaceae bacterium]